MATDVDALEEDGILDGGITVDAHAGGKNAAADLASGYDTALADHAVQRIAAPGSSWTLISENWNYDWFEQNGKWQWQRTSRDAAIARGHELFISMNCAGCHGYDAAGNMGPNLTDHYWRYGGTPASGYKSIYEGRPQGMPAWGSALPRAEIWKIVAYLQSLGGMVAATDYQGGLQGDHDVSSVAPGIGAIGAANGVPVPADNAAAPDVPASAPVPTT